MGVAVNARPLPGPHTAASQQSTTSPVPTEDSKTRRDVLRRLSRLEPGTRWINAALRSCIVSRQTMALSCMAAATRDRLSKVSVSRQAKAFARAVARVFRQAENLACRSALCHWSHNAKQLSYLQQRKQKLLAAQFEYVERGLVGVAFSLQRAKSDALRALRLHAASQAWRQSHHKLQVVARRR